MRGVHSWLTSTAVVGGMQHTPASFDRSSREREGCDHAEVGDGVD
jgi:hypothetical protein